MLMEYINTLQIHLLYSLSIAIGSKYGISYFANVKMWFIAIKCSRLTKRLLFRKGYSYRSKINPVSGELYRNFCLCLLFHINMLKLGTSWWCGTTGSHAGYMFGLGKLAEKLRSQLTDLHRTIYVRLLLYQSFIKFLDNHGHSTDKASIEWYWSAS